MALPLNGQRHDRTALILYGSETGNSQDVAEELALMTERLHFMTRVKEMDLVEIVRRMLFRPYHFLTLHILDGLYFWNRAIYQNIP